MSRSSKAQRAKQKDRASVSAANGDAAAAAPADDDCAGAAAAVVACNDVDDTDGALDSTAADAEDADVRSSRDTASDVCTRSDSASHMIKRDSSSKYAQESACSAALLSAGKMNLMLGGRLCARKERRVKKSVK